MQNLESDGMIEHKVIPAQARSAGLVRCFAYHGSSMSPTFRAGQLLYVRPSVRDLVPGDVIVFVDRCSGRYFVHRVVSVTEAGLSSRGDNNWQNDAQFVPLEQVIGRVEMLEDQGRLKSTAGGSQALRSLRRRWWARRVRRSLSWALRRPYRALYTFPLVRRLLRRWFSRRLVVVRLETPDGPLFKTTYRGRTVAHWWPQLKRFECRKPYDLLVPRPHDPE